MVGDLIFRANRRLIAILRRIGLDKAVETTQSLVESVIPSIELPLHSPAPYLSIANMVRKGGL